MGISKIECVYRYPLCKVPGVFTVFVSKHSDGSCHGSVFYYTKTGTWATSNPELIDLEFKMHPEIGRDLEAVRDACLDWSRSMFGAEVYLGDEEKCEP